MNKTCKTCIHSTKEGLCYYNNLIKVITEDYNCNNYQEKKVKDYNYCPECDIYYDLERTCPLCEAYQRIEEIKEW